MDARVSEEKRGGESEGGVPNGTKRRLEVIVRICYRAPEKEKEKKGSDRKANRSGEYVVEKNVYLVECKMERKEN